MENDVRARSWFCVLNNPADHGFSGTPDEIAEQMKERWITDNPQRTCAVAFCVSAEGLPHCHAVFEDCSVPGKEITEECADQRSSVHLYVHKF